MQPSPVLRGSPARRFCLCFRSHCCQTACTSFYHTGRLPGNQGPAGPLRTSENHRALSSESPFTDILLKSTTSHQISPAEFTLEAMKMLGRSSLGSEERSLIPPGYRRRHGSTGTSAVHIEHRDGAVFTLHAPVLLDHTCSSISTLLC